MDKKIYVLVGPPGVGKSTWVEKEFQGECSIIGTDAILEAIAGVQGITYDQAFAKYMKAVEKMMWKEFDSVVSNKCYPIIIDRTNMSVKSRAKFFERLRTFHKDHGYNIHAVVFPVPEKEEWKRRLDSRPGKTIPDHVVQSMLKSFEMPTEREGFTSITVIENNS